MQREQTQHETSQIELMPVSALRPYQRNARTHSKKQVVQLAESIRQFGFTNPVLISDDGEIVAGHGRVLAAKQIGMLEVPVLRLSHLSDEQRRAYVLADNKLALNAAWDNELLAVELQALIDLEFDVTVTGFSLAEIDLTLDQAREASAEVPDGADLLPELPTHAVTRVGDLWQLGGHRLLCGDASIKGDIERLVGAGQVDLVFTDPPYNVRVNGHVGGLGKIQHREFAFASGEMSSDEFTSFLEATLANAAGVAKNGAIAFICMDWRHMRELMDACDGIFSELKNLCVWNKTNGGMGSFYRSKHELIFVYKVGTAPHTNSFGLGETGRYRTNVWDHAGVSSLGANRSAELAMHPTVKPVALIADAIRDCSRRGETVLDIFAGSGSTLIAAETCGRKRELWMRIKAHQAQLLEAAHSAGEDESKILPHPDDIIEDDLKGYRLLGPINEEEQRRLNKTINYRDALIMQDALDQRPAKAAQRGKRSTSKSGDKARAADLETAIEQSGALLMAMTLDHQVPERYRLDTIAILMRQFQLDRLTRRELLKKVYNAWKALGCMGTGHQKVSIAGCLSDRLHGSCKQGGEADCPKPRAGLFEITKSERHMLPTLTHRAMPQAIVLNRF